MKKSGIQLLLFLLITSLSLTQFACDMKLPAMPWDKKPPAQTEEATEEETGGEEAPPEEQLDMTKLIPEAMRNLPYSEVSIPMADGLTIVGRLYDPALTKDEDGETVAPADSETEYTGPKYPLIILLHGLNLTQSHWQTLPKTLMESGYSVFAMDLRGHGQSTKMRGRSINWRSLNGDDWTQVYRDVAKVITYFGTTEDYPEVDASNVALVGEQLGANVAIWSAKRSEKVHALVLLTPSMSIKGLDAGKGLIDYPYNTMILVNQDEQDSYSAARYLYGWLQGPKELQVYQHAGIGAEMITAKPIIAYQIRDWLIKVFPPAKIPGAALSEQELEKAEAEGKAETAKAPAKH